jgi:hypothetical protein
MHFDDLASEMVMCSSSLPSGKRTGKESGIAPLGGVEAFEKVRPSLAVAELRAGPEYCTVQWGSAAGVVAA